MLSSFRPLVPQPLQQCLNVEEQVFYKEHHDRVRKNNVFVYYLMLVVSGFIGLIFLYGFVSLFMESRRTFDTSLLRFAAFFCLFLSILLFVVCGYYIREVAIKKEIDRLIKKCSR